MAIAYDNATSAYFGTASTSHTQSHTSTGSNLVGAVFVRCYDGSGVSGVTWGGNAMTQSGTEQTLGSDKFSKWFIVGQPSGAQNVVVSLSASRRIDIDIVSLTSALQSGQPDAAGSATGSSASASNAVTTVANNAMLVAAYFSNGAGDPSGSHTNWTQRAITTGRHAVGTSGVLTPAGSKTQTISLASSGQWAISQMSFSPSTSTNYTMAADAGSYTLTGTAAVLKSARTMVAAAGSYVLTGTAAALKRGYGIVAESGSYALTGTAAMLTSARRMVADAGSYALTGTAAVLKSARRLIADVGSYILTGSSAGLTTNAWSKPSRDSSSFAKPSRPSSTWTRPDDPNQ